MSKAKPSRSTDGPAAHAAAPERIAARVLARELSATELAHVAGGMTNWSTESALQCDKEIAIYV